jgi:hypothetical protein
MQPGDVKATFADVDDLMSDIQFAPFTPPEVGIKRFVRCIAVTMGFLRFRRRPRPRSME